MTDDLPAVDPALRRPGQDLLRALPRRRAATPDHFVETWHDDGPTDLLECMRAYRESASRASCAPTTCRRWTAAATTGPATRLGRLFAIGYIRGLHEASTRRNCRCGEERADGRLMRIAITGAGELARLRCDRRMLWAQGHSVLAVAGTGREPLRALRIQVQVQSRSDCGPDGLLRCRSSSW